MNNILSLFLVLSVINNNAMDRVALITQALKARQEEAAHVSKKIYLGTWKNQMKHDLVIEYPSEEGNKKITLKGNSGVIDLDAPVLLTQLKGKPDYLAMITINNPQADEKDTYKKMQISVVLEYSTGHKNFYINTCPKNMFTLIDLSQSSIPQGITIDGTLSGKEFGASTVGCWPRTRP